MLKWLTILFLMMSHFTMAQYKSQPTQFDSFIASPNIEWAAYADYYLNFEKHNLNKLLFSRFVRNEIKASLPTNSGSYAANFISYISKDSLDRLILEPMMGLPIYDSDGNYPDFSKIEPYKIDTTSSTFTSITQILYFEDGVLKSYIPWVSPSIIELVTAQTRQFVGYNEYLSTCYNHRHNYLPKENGHDIYLGESTTNFDMDSAIARSRLKELYGRNLLETLIPHIQDNKMDIRSFDTNIKLNPDELINYYDSLGNFVVSKYLGIQTSLEDFTKMQLVQKWYYNYNENIVFNIIKEMYLCGYKNENDALSPILKIVFK